MNDFSITDEKQDRNPWERTVACPHCDKKFWIKVQLKLTELESAVEPEDGDSITRWKNGLEPAKRKILAEAEATGLLKAFADVVAVAKGDQVPFNMEKFLLTFFQTAVRKMVSSQVLDFYIAEFPNREITFLGGQGVLAVLADGVIKCFIPSEFAMGVQVRNASGNGHGFRTSARLDELPVWRRTRMGYVIQGEIFADEIKRILVGSFANPRIEIKNRR